MMRRTTYWLKHFFERVRSKVFGVRLCLLMADTPSDPSQTLPELNFQNSQELATPTARPGVTWTCKTCVLCKLPPSSFFCFLGESCLSLFLSFNIFIPSVVPPLVMVLTTPGLEKFEGEDPKSHFPRMYALAFIPILVAVVDPTNAN